MKATRVSVCASVAMTLATAASAALFEGRTTDGRPFLTGGIGIEEVDAIRQRANEYSLQLVVAASSGAYLADQTVKIWNARNEPVLDGSLNAPWLLVDLPPGSYRIQVTHGTKSLERRVTIGNHPQRIVLHFDVPADTPASIVGIERTPR
jgi:hypothetical protein